VLKVKYKGIEVGLDFDHEPGLADNGDLELDLQALLVAAGTAAREAGTALALFVDELQYVEVEGVANEAEAVARMIEETRGYPYFNQE